MAATRNKAEKQLCKGIALFSALVRRQLHDYQWRMTNFTFCERRKQAMTKLILFMNLDMVDRNSAPEELACICDKVSDLE